MKMQELIDAAIYNYRQERENIPDEWFDLLEVEPDAIPNPQENN